MFSGRLWNLFIDSFPKMFMHGLTVTIPLTVISFSLAMVIAIVVALVQFANIKVLKQIWSLLYLDLSWYAAFSPAVYCVFWLVEDRNFTRSISSSSNCICIK